ncbi:MAG: hypothetical protein WBY44_31525 [Bryobacteraceae bacterium]
MPTRTNVVLTLLAATLGHAQMYPVHLTTRESPGQRYTLTASGSSATTGSRGGHILSSEEFQVSFQATVQVIELDRKGQPIRRAFTVQSFRKTISGESTDLLKPGTIVLTDGSKEDWVSLPDHALDPATRQAFEVIFSRHKPDDITDDEIFGAPIPKKIGDTWPMNAEAAVKNAAESGLSIPEGHLTGTTSLVSKGKVGTTDCLNLRGEVKADGVSGGDLPPGATLDEGKLAATFRGCAPMEETELSHSSAQRFRCCFD